MMLQGESHCPRCAMPTYSGGICLNDDCSYPATTSRNAERRADAERAASKARERDARRAAGKARKTKPTAPPKARTTGFRGVGKLTALTGGGAGVYIVMPLAPDAPLLWMAAAAGGLWLGWVLRQVILFGALAAGAVYLFTGSRSPQPADTPPSLAPDGDFTTG